MVEEEIIKDEFTKLGFPSIHILDGGVRNDAVRSWVVSSADPEDKRLVNGEIKTGGVAISISALEVEQNVKAPQMADDLLALKARHAAETLRELLKLADAA